LERDRAQLCSTACDAARRSNLAGSDVAAARCTGMVCGTPHCIAGAPVPLDDPGKHCPAKETLSVLACCCRPWRPTVGDSWSYETLDERPDSEQGVDHRQNELGGSCLTRRPTWTLQPTQDARGEANAAADEMTCDNQDDRHQGRRCEHSFGGLLPPTDLDPPPRDSRHAHQTGRRAPLKRCKRPSASPRLGSSVGLRRLSARHPVAEHRRRAIVPDGVCATLHLCRR
jgi:hypothetical protein